MMRGEPVTVLRPRQAGTDSYRDPVLAWDGETVADVLVAPATPSDRATGTDPNAIRADATLYFPRDWNGAPLRGCRVLVRGHRYRVVGDPLAYDAGTSPTRWNLAVPVTREDGGGNG